MTRLMLDTSAYSAFMRGHPEVRLALQHADEIYLNPIILGELLTGFLKGKRKKKNEKELQAFLLSPRVSVVDLDEDTSERYAVILNSLWKAGTPIPTNDIWIAASAMQHGVRLLTGDAHYQRVTQVLVDYIHLSEIR
ncbi:MAG: type II toxin-antitoxin system VapC family toxin [Deltaproteobacteria bacterium]|nr:type II toxin-antitoxin system VapC family toxin [Deltaproteobacteria bacterium]